MLKMSSARVRHDRPQTLLRRPLDYRSTGRGAYDVSAVDGTSAFFGDARHASGVAARSGFHILSAHPDRTLALPGMVGTTHRLVFGSLGMNFASAPQAA